ncbi:hypothetical protein TKK_0019527 [Trichogramma kaykai]
MFQDAYEEFDFHSTPVPDEEINGSQISLTNEDSDKTNSLSRSSSDRETSSPSSHKRKQNHELFCKDVMFMND